ncbi:hypothetical protein [Okeania sp. SIO1I7]|nr:hypothetical protein [Okeania sp. SIO1I7]
MNYFFGKEEGRRKKEEGRRKKEEGRRKKILTVKGNKFWVLFIST